VSDFERLSRELLSKIEDRAARAKAEREAERRAAELKREAQRAAQAARTSAAVSVPHIAEALPGQLRGVRVVRDGRVVSAGREARSVTEPEPGERVAIAREPAISASSEIRAPRVGDRVRLLT